MRFLPIWLKLAGMRCEAPLLCLAADWRWGGDGLCRTLVWRCAVVGLQLSICMRHAQHLLLLLLSAPDGVLRGGLRLTAA